MLLAVRQCRADDAPRPDAFRRHSIAAILERHYKAVNGITAEQAYGRIVFLAADMPRPMPRIAKAAVRPSAQKNS